MTKTPKMIRNIPLAMLLLLSTPAISAYSTLSMSSLPKPKGCASKPYEKKKVAVFGAGGNMGATIFGFLQRASSLYGTGIASTPSMPRAVCATALASESLNKRLLTSFKLAYAGENHIALTNANDPASIERSLSGMDAVILGTVYQLDKRPVTSGTYETGPNSKTLEFNLDKNFMAFQVMEESLEFHCGLFRDSIRACKSAGVKHVVVIETPATDDAKPFARILDEEGVAFTYICTDDDGDEEMKINKGYTFESGMQTDQDIYGYSLPSNYASARGYDNGDWADSISDDDSVTASAAPTSREDIAALAVQSLLSLDWEKSRVLRVRTKSEFDKTPESFKGTTKPARSDGYWCKESDILALKLAEVQ